MILQINIMLILICGQMFIFLQWVYKSAVSFFPHKENKMYLNILILFTYLFGSLVH